MFCRIEKYYTSEILYGYRKKGEYKSKKHGKVKLWTFVQECIFEDKNYSKHPLLNNNLNPNQTKVEQRTENSRTKVEWLNTLNPSLKLTYEFVKPTNPQLFLHYSSNHPRSVFKAIVYGQAINVRMICSRDEYVKNFFETLKVKFIERGYS